MVENSKTSTTIVICGTPVSLRPSLSPLHQSGGKAAALCPKLGAACLGASSARASGHAHAFHRLDLVPGERIELPTNGLQNRCSTAELTRRRLACVALGN